MAQLRAPICTIVGHVDHGKTTILDWIRGSAVARGEAGGITQAISSTNLQIKVINDICGELLKTLKIDVTVPGVLFIDTPGHAAFTNLRKRGGNLADIAVLVVDINEGFKPQTLESIEILQQYKTPFVIAANKIDLIPGWQSNKKLSLIQNIQKQLPNVKQKIENQTYEIVGELNKLGFPSERFDRVDDPAKQITIIPISAKSGEGLPELLMMITGLAQKFLNQCLECNVDGPGMGTVLEVKEEKGLGTTMDVILHDGGIKKGDTIVIGGIDEPVVTKVKILLEPEGKQLKQLSEVHAAIGVKISASDIKDVVSGMPLKVTNEQYLEQTKQKVQEEVDEVIIETDNEGVVVKADSLGSLEAMTTLLKEKDVLIKRASIGHITKKDIAEANSEQEITNKVILGFGVKVLDEDAAQDVKIITHEIIYKILDDLEKWKEDTMKELEVKELDGLTRPAKMQIIPNCVFRQSNPAVVGVEIMLGHLTVGAPLLKLDGSKISEVKTMQLDGDHVPEGKKGDQVAIAIPHITVGRQIDEHDIMYVDVPEADFIKFKKLKKYLSHEEIEVLKELAELKREENPVWGV